MKNIIIKSILVSSIIALNNTNGDAKLLSQEEIKIIFASTIKTFWDKNYQLPEKLLIEQPHYFNGLNTTVYFIRDLSKYSATIDAFNGKVYVCGGYYNMTAQKNLKLNIISKDEIIKINQSYFKKLSIENYALIFKDIQKNHPDDKYCSIAWKRTFKGYEYEYDTAYFTFREDGFMVSFSIFLPSMEPQSLEVKISSEKAKIGARSQAEMIRKKYDYGLEIAGTGEAKLLIVNPNYIHKSIEFFYKRNFANPRLAWVVEIKSKHSERGDIVIMHVWIDAENGEYLGGYFYNW